MSPVLCVLFLAHDGVAKAPLWQSWCAGHESEVLFRVHCDRTSPSMYPAFVKQHQLATAIHTEWGATSVVRAVCASMKEILSIYPTVQRIHLVSGNCVPVQPVEQLLSLPHATYWPFCDDNSKRIEWQGHQFEYRKHSQFIHVCRADAARLAAFVDWDVLHAYDGVRRVNARNTTSDEWMPWAMLTYDRPTPVNVEFRPLTFVSWPAKRSSHPILWTSITRKRKIEFGPRDTQCMSLETLWPSLQHNGYFFMRKVAPEADVSVELIADAWDYLQGHTK